MAEKDVLAARSLKPPRYGQQLCWPRRGPRVALERSLHGLSMRYDVIVATGLVFWKRKRQAGALASRRNRCMVRQPLWRTRWTESQA